MVDAKGSASQEVFLSWNVRAFASALTALNNSSAKSQLKVQRAMPDKVWEGEHWSNLRSLGLNQLREKS